jgi:lipoate-protein ligase A
VPLIECRLLIDPPAEGQWNMAVDEALLDSAVGDARATLRFYRWSRPTLSLGYFQAVGQRVSHAASSGCPCVRRPTGGGAIIHDAELTYSLALPATHALASSPVALARAVHETLIAALTPLSGATVTLAPAAPSVRPEPFLCFARRVAGDVLLGEAKIAGSAQRRRQAAVLQHGSILLRRSIAAPEFAGWEDLTGVLLEALELARRWHPLIAERLGLRVDDGDLTATEQARAAALDKGKYATGRWTERR